MAHLVMIVVLATGQLDPLTHTGSLAEGLRSPARIAVAPDGTVLVTDPPENQIARFQSDGTPLPAWDVPEGPIGIAVHPDGSYFVSRRDDAQVAIYADSGGVFTFLGLLEDPGVTFVRPTDLAIDPVSEDVFVVDGEADVIYKFPGDGSPVMTIAGTGELNGQFLYPSAVSVDTARDRLIVADQNNFRLHVFTTGGVFQDQFGDRMKYPGGGVSEGWMPRGQGTAVDADGRIYVADALMGTVRIFDLAGQELGKVVDFGSDPGDLRTPCDLVLSNDGAQLYVVNTNGSQVEIYDVPNWTALPPANEPGDAPLNTDGRLQVLPHGIASDVTDTGLEPAAGSRSTYDGPHMTEATIICGRCHGITDEPGGHVGLVEGQTNMCMSCHTAGGQALELPLHELDSPVAQGGEGTSHAWGVSAVNAGAQSEGPTPGGALELYVDAAGNIKCATCHDQHSTLNEPYLRLPVGYAQLCGDCHQETRSQWFLAGHSDGDSTAFNYPVGPGREACAKCHSGLGYIDFAAGLPQEEQRTDKQVHSCFVCHGPHGFPADEELLRIYDDVTLPGDVTFTDRGPSATCMTCHNGRTVPDDGGTPHYALGGVMLEGINAITFGENIPNSPHTTLAQCVDCHMAPSPAEGQPGAGKVGGHTFSIKVHDPDDPDFGFENVDNACNTASCHGAGLGMRAPELLITQINRLAYGDYDGDGTIEGVQDETQGLMDLVFAEITGTGAVFLGHYPYWDFSGVVDDPPGFLQAVQDAVWNWEYVDNSGDLGIHNTGFAVGLLQVTYKVLTGTDVPGAFLRYDAATEPLPDTVVEITAVNGGAPVEAGGAFTVDFTIEDDSGTPIDIADLNRLRVYVSGPAYNYQRVIAQDGDITHFAQNPDGSYTYTAVDPFPTVYDAPLNDSPLYGPADGELTGQPLLEGTYTVLIETRRVFGSVRKAGDATFDFVVADDPLSPPVLDPRQFVLRDNCNDCHLDLQLHGSNRFAVTGCVVCHTAGAEDLITDPPTTPGLTILFKDMIHKVHSGHGLPTVAATANGADPYRYEIIGHGESVNDFSDVGFPVIPKGITDCVACHGGAAQEGEIYTNITRTNCATCHNDIDFTTGTILDQTDPSVQDGLLTVADLTDPTYRAFPGGINHTFVDDTTCGACHGPGATWDVEVMHQHPTDPEQEGTDPVIEIVSVGGMTGGGGTYFVAGDIPEVTFRLRDNFSDPLELVPGDSSVLDRLEFYVAGTTSLYQTVIGTQRPWSGGSLAVDPGNWVDNFLVDGTYTFIFEDPFPANYPAQANALGEPPAELIFPFEEGWGHLYTAGGTPLDNGTYTIFGLGRRLTPTDGEREPLLADAFDVAFGANDPIVPYDDTVTSEMCNACHGVMAFHGNQREGVHTCLACHTAGSQDGGTYESVDFRIMLHKIHNARNLDVVAQGGAYELNGHSGIADFSHLLISAMPGEAAECEACHVTDDWKNPPVRANMRTWKVVCTSCHDASDTATHVEAATLAGTFVESCVSCHGPGAAFSVEKEHMSP